ncbi:hypothetical protein GCK72_007926 [Caenorhabditis remanei]|uniref:Bestrophin homolog n=1 Tax=Caenorhabditis remanei TaxID=31234 RepID=A0A6A5HMS9_CAERE|nr:hypothetical protein GCK72_007926 [Caenorhabditis remanei]KAF1767966.1 hypothetical protein GCK72_007926 [Caenorhabditis remanei]
MTVTYSLDVASSSFFCLYKLLFRWKGSIWKSVWAELVVWLCLYAVLSAIYRCLLGVTQRATFEDLCIFFDTYSNFIPITFMLGFYVSAVFTRWWQIFDNIGWIDTPCLWITQYVKGESERAKCVRRNCIRYAILTQAMVYRDVAASVRKRFPTFNHLVTAGLMTEKEMLEFDSIPSPHAKYWQPMHWLFSMISLARDEGMIKSDIIYVDLMEKMRQFRVNILSLTLYDWVPVPLVYTQVVHLAVRSYFLVALFGRQYLHPDTSRVPDYKTTIDLYVPIMSVLQFIFFIGWMKVAEVLLNPLGEDDDDFECNWILDRNLQVGLMVVDTAYNRYPTLEKDQFWEDVLPEPLYTAESAMRPLNPQVGSCAEMPTEEEPFMVRPRRRTLSRMSHWDGDMEDTDVVPVVGLSPHPRDGSNYASGESLAFSNSFANGGRKLSEMFRRMRAGSRIGDRYRKRHSSAQDFEHGIRKKNSLEDDVDSIRDNKLDQASGTPKSGRLWSSLPQTQLEEMLKNRDLSGSSQVKYNTDGMKERDVIPNPTPVTDHIDMPSHVPASPSWYNESLPVIKEEEEAKRKSNTNTDTDSPKSSKASKTSIKRIELRRSSSSGSDLGKTGRLERKKSE